jgi:hypothetical protein
MPDLLCPIDQEKLIVTVTWMICPALTASGVARVVPVKVVKPL